MNTVLRLLLPLLLMSIAGPALAQERGTREEALALVDAAVEHVRKVGPTQAFRDFSDKSNLAWRSKDLYVFAYTMGGINVSHGINDRLVGKNLLEMRDPNGKFLIRSLRDVAATGGGWVDYEWPHPQTKKVEPKASFVRRLPNFDGFVGVGVYR